MVHEVRAEMVAAVLEIVPAPGASVGVGDTLALLESMKMEIPVLAEVAGTVVSVAVEPGAVVQDGDTILTLEETADAAAGGPTLEVAP